MKAQQDYPVTDKRKKTNARRLPHLYAVLYISLYKIYSREVFLYFFSVIFP